MPAEGGCRYQQYLGSDGSELLAAKKGAEARRLAASKSAQLARGGGSGGSSSGGAGSSARPGGALGRAPLSQAGDAPAGPKPSRVGAPGVAAILYGKGGIGEDPLLAALRKQQLERAATVILPSRHSRFGSQFVVQGVANR